MAFHHFHKHSKKYLVFATAAMIFSLVTFSVPSAIQAFGAGGTEEVVVRFQTLSGRTVELTNAQWFLLNREIRGFVSADKSGTYADLYADYDNLPLIHAMLMAEADEMGIVVPEKLYQERWEQYLLILQMQLRGQGLTKSALQNYLSSAGVRSIERFQELMRESIRTELYRRTVSGVQVHNPEDIERHFRAANEEVTLQYVDFPADRLREELAASPPEEATLAAWYEELSPGRKMGEFSYPLRLSMDLALLDFSAADPDAIPAEFLADWQEPTDEELLQAYRGDPDRYGSGDNPAEAAADIPAEVKERILKDRRLLAAMRAMRDQYQDFVTRLEEDAKLEDVLGPDDAGQGGDDQAAKDAGGEDSPPGGPRHQDGDAMQDGDAVQEGEAGQEADKTAEDEAAAQAAAAAEAARKAAQEEKRSAEFARLAAALGLTVTRLTEVERDELADVDPPGDENFPFLAAGLFAPGDIQYAAPARDHQYGYLVRLIERKVPEPKPFEVVVDEVREAWIEEQAATQAEEAAVAFRNKIRERALAQLPEARRQGVEAAYEKALQEVEEDKDLDETSRKFALEDLESQWFHNFMALVGTSEGTIFEEEAQAAGLECKVVGPLRRNVSTQPVFQDRYEGATRFLFGQGGSSYAGTAQLMGYAKDTVSEVLEDDEEQVYYVARVLDRRAPDLSEMRPKDLEEAENANKQELEYDRRGSAYDSPFSFHHLCQLHHPEIRVRPEADETDVTN